MKRVFCSILLLLFLASAAAAQSLAESAQKEKERRESLKGKPGVVVTNADLSKTQKKPSVSLTSSAAGPEGAAAAQPVGGEAEAGSSEANRDAAERQADIQKRYDDKKVELETKAARAKERTGLLDLKLKSLQQQFYSFGNMQTKDQVQRQIAETYQTLQAAAAEQAKTKNELDRFLELGAKDKAAAAGIK